MERSVRKFNQTYSGVIFWVLPILLILIAGWVFGNVTLIFTNTLKIFFVLDSVILSSGYLVWWITSIIGTKLQSYKTSPPLIIQEIKETSATLFTVACISVVPFTKYQLGGKIGFTWEFKDTLPVFFLKMALLVMFSDLFTYWKHWLLHRPYLFAYHKSHHTFHDPTCFASFGLHPRRLICLTF